MSQFIDVGDTTRHKSANDIYRRKWYENLLLLLNISPLHIVRTSYVVP